MGKYLKGKGYTPIYVATMYEEHDRGEYSLIVLGAGETFDVAMKYAQGRVDWFIEHGYDVQSEGYATTYPTDDDYMCVLLNAQNDVAIIRAQKCPLVLR